MPKRGHHGVLMGDGIVRFVNENINVGNLHETQLDKTTGHSRIGIWEALGTNAGSTGKRPA